jgi:hypothetical protein
MLIVYTRHLKSCEHRNDSRWTKLLLARPYSERARFRSPAFYEGRGYFGRGGEIRTPDLVFPKHVPSTS